MTDSSQNDFIAVSNRLPVDRVIEPDGTPHWRRSPGGLVTALEPVMRAYRQQPAGRLADLDPRYAGKAAVARTG